MKNIYAPIEAIVENVIQETENIKTIVLKPREEFSFQTGQFIQLTVPGVGEAPFTPSSNPAIKEKFDVTFMKVGRVTDKVHELKPNDKVGVRGPYGTGYPLDEFKGKEVLIVGGGVGLAPLRSLLLALFNEKEKYKKIFLKYGARTPDDIVYKGEVKQWEDKANVEMSVDRCDTRWKGKVCVVTGLLDDFKTDLSNAIAVVCGPPIMMKFTTFKLVEFGYKPEQIYLSMEKNMSCGLGKCGHCRIGNYYACKDGPVFTYDKIKDFPEIWD